MSSYRDNRAKLSGKHARLVTTTYRAHSYKECPGGGGGQEKRKGGSLSRKVRRQWAIPAHLLLPSLEVLEALSEPQAAPIRQRELF